MAFTYDPIFAADPNNPAVVAKNAAITIFDPAVPGVPVTITDPTGSPLPNPLTVNSAGFGPAFQHATLDRIGWSGAGYSGYFTAYEGMKNEAVMAKAAALEAASAAEGADNSAATAAATAEAARATMAASVPAWKTGIAYAQGQKVVAPSGDVATAASDHTSGASYDDTKWTPSSQESRLGNVEAKLSRGILPSGTDLNTVTGPADTGAWGLSGANTYPNAPAITSDAVFELFRSAGNSLSVLQRITTGSKMVWREAIDAGAGTWSEWEQTETLSNAAAAAAAAKGYTDTLRAETPATIESALTTAGVLRNARSIPDDAEPAFAITDEDGRRSFLEIANDGSPTAHATDLIARAVARVLDEDELMGLAMKEIAPGGGYKFAITDDADNIAIGILPDGTVVLRQPDTTLPIMGWGTSMMNGYTGNGTTLLTATADNLGVPRETFLNRGRSGMGSVGIAAQQGGTPALLTVTGGTIPASGAVGVNAGAKHVATFQYWGTYAVPGTLAGVPGTLIYSGGNNASAGVDATFTRTTAGDAVLCPTPRPFIPDTVQAYSGNKAILWIGRNDMASVDQVIANYRAMIDLIGSRDILVLAELNGPGVDAYNDRLAAEFPHYFVDLKAWLIANGLQTAGITPTTQDQADIAAGIVPTSLMADTIHTNGQGFAAAGVYLASIIDKKGWL